MSLINSVTKSFAETHASLNLLEKRVRPVKLISILTSKSFLFLDQTLVELDELITYCNIRLRSILLMMKGNFPSDLIPPEQLGLILDHASNVLYESNPNYGFSFESIESYYRLNNIGFTITGQLLISIAIPIRPDNQQPMRLYKVEATHVPIDMHLDNGKQLNSYTKIELDTDYISIHENNFVQLSESNLKSCRNFESTFICDDVLIQIHRSKMNCSVALLWNSPQDTIKMLCKFNYFHNFEPTAMILDSADQLLLAHFQVSWTLDCEDKSVPPRHEGSRYAVIMKSSLCKCQILSTTNFVEYQINACKVGTPGLFGLN